MTQCTFSLPHRGEKQNRFLPATLARKPYQATDQPGWRQKYDHAPERNFGLEFRDKLLEPVHLFRPTESPGSA